jgi:hypothetical protein
MRWSRRGRRRGKINIRDIEGGGGGGLRWVRSSFFLLMIEQHWHWTWLCFFCFCLHEGPEMLFGFFFYCYAAKLENFFSS